MSKQQSKVVFQLDTTKKLVLLHDFDPDFKPEMMEKTSFSNREVTFRGQRVLHGSRERYLEGYKTYSINRYSMDYRVEAYFRTTPDSLLSKREFIGTCKIGEIPRNRF